MPIPTPPSQRAQISSVDRRRNRAADGRHQEQNSRDDQNRLSSKAIAQRAGHQRSHHAADQCGCNHHALDEWRELKLGRQLDQCARDNCRVETEQKPAECGNEADQEQVIASTLGRCVERVRHGILPEASTVRGTVSCLRLPNYVATYGRDSSARRYPQHSSRINRAQVRPPGDERKICPTGLLSWTANPARELPIAAPRTAQLPCGQVRPCRPGNRQVP